MDMTNMLSAKWKQLSGSVQKTWGKLTDDELAQINGNKEILLGKLQEKYSWTKAEAEDNIKNFMDGLSEMRDDAMDEAEDAKDEAEGLWNRMVSRVQEAWEDFTDEDLREIKHDKDALLDKIAKKYEITKDEAKAKLGDMFK